MTQGTISRLAQRGGLIEALRAPAALFSLAVRARSVLFDRGLKTVVQVDLPVVSIGNLSAGGTGKTPMVAWTCRRLIERGWRPGILSRGYGGTDKDPEGNDEARMLRELLPDVPHVQNPKRVDGARELERLGADAIVLDDGFQHRRLARDLDVVLVDATRPWGLPRPERGGEPVRALLPRGLLREPPTALARAHVIVVTRTDGVEHGALEALFAQLRAWAPDAAFARAIHRPVRLREFASGAERALTELRGLDVELLSGLGNPDAFEATTLALGANVAAHRAFPDHHRFTAAELEGLGDECAALTTAKDAARLDRSTAPRGLLVLDVELDVVDGEAELEALLDGLPEGHARRARRSIHEGLHG